MFGTGGAKRMLSRMFGGEDARCLLGDLSGGARAFQPGHAAKFAQGPRRSGSSFCCPQAGSRRSGLRVSCIVVSALLARLCRLFVDMIRRKKGDARRSEPRRAAPSHRLTRRLPPTQSQARRARSRDRRPTAAGARPTEAASRPGGTNRPATTAATPPADPSPVGPATTYAPTKRRRTHQKTEQTQNTSETKEQSADRPPTPTSYPRPASHTTASRTTNAWHVPPAGPHQHASRTACPARTTAANRTNSAHAAASPPDSAEPANPAATTPRNHTRNRADADPAASPGPKPKRISQHRTLPPRTTPTDIHDRLIPSPQPPHRNNRNRTKATTAHLRSEEPTPPNPGGHCPHLPRAQTLAGLMASEGSWLIGGVFRVTLEADWRLVGIPARGAAPAASTAGDRWFRRPANPQGAPVPDLSKLPYRDRSGFAPWRIMRRAADTRWRIPEVWLRP